MDRSGSMAEDKKFPYAMDAAREVIVNLSDRDVISLIAFNAIVRRGPTLPGGMSGRANSHGTRAIRTY